MLISAGAGKEVLKLSAADGAMEGAVQTPARIRRS